MRPPGNSKRAVQPVPAASESVEGLVLADAARRSRALRNNRLRCLDARLPQPATEGRGFGWVQPVIAQSLTGIHASVAVVVGQETRTGAGKLPNRPGKGDSIVAFVSCFKSSRWVNCRVRQRGLADGLRCIYKKSSR